MNEKKFQRYDWQNLEPACFYLRKSREDQEAETRGEGETLTKHRNALYRLAHDYGVTISKVFEEIASGESLIHRQAMLSVLKEVEEGKWRSVWCMDMDRLGRGNMQEQGLILETFKQAHTLIVTPRKIYNLNDEFDEEYTEFEAFMARKELKIITRRLQGGRLRAIEEGNYLATLPPFGYKIVKDGRKRFLQKNPEQSAITALIWQLCQNHNLGAGNIASELNHLGLPSYTGQNWTTSAVLAILKNPAYAGITAWRRKEEKKTAVPDKKKTVRSRPREEQVWIYNTHEPYLTVEEFSAVQNRLSQNTHRPGRPPRNITNPLAGLIKCARCGCSMVYRPYAKQKPHLICYNKRCRNKGTRFEFVEQALLSGLTAWLEDYSLVWKDYPPEKQPAKIGDKQQLVQTFSKQAKQLAQQKSRLHELLENGIYDEKTYQERYQLLLQRLSKTQHTLALLEPTTVNETAGAKTQDVTPKFTNPLTLYNWVHNPGIKNKLLKTVLERAVYYKEQHQRGDDFTLILYPRLPKH